MDFSTRSRQTELMDTEAVDAADFARCLADLATVNVVTLAARPTMAWLTRATRAMPHGAAFSLLDVGFGHGDMLRRIHRWSERRGLLARLSGIDLTPQSTAAARAATPAAMAIDFQTGDVLDYRAQPPPDFIISSLFTHHLADADIVRFLAWMEATAQRGWMVNDLHRNAFAYHGFALLARLAGWHRFVRHDGPVSIARSFRRDDWTRLLQQAAVPGSIAWRFPFRYCVERVK